MSVYGLATAERGETVAAAVIAIMLIADTLVTSTCRGLGIPVVALAISAGFLGFPLALRGLAIGSAPKTYG